jgi:hypothetical protein
MPSGMPAVVVSACRSLSFVEQDFCIYLVLKMLASLGIPLIVPMIAVRSFQAGFFKVCVSNSSASQHRRTSLRAAKV